MQIFVCKYFFWFNKLFIYYRFFLCCFFYYGVPSGSMGFHRIILCSFDSALRITVLFYLKVRHSISQLALMKKCTHYTMVPPPCLTVGVKFLEWGKFNFWSVQATIVMWASCKYSTTLKWTSLDKNPNVSPIKKIGKLLQCERDKTLWGVFL